MEQYGLHDLVGLGFLCFIIWFIFKCKNHFGSLDRDYRSSNTSGTREYYYAKSIYHTSGMRHVCMSDAWDECRELEKQYPGESFTVETIRQ